MAVQRCGVPSIRPLFSWAVPECLQGVVSSSSEILLLQSFILGKRGDNCAPMYDSRVWHMLPLVSCVYLQPSSVPKGGGLCPVSHNNSGLSEPVGGGLRACQTFLEYIVQIDTS